MTDISREAVERLADYCGDVLFKEYEGHLPVGNIPPHTLKDIDETLRALRDALDEAHRTGWDDAIEAATAEAERWATPEQLKYADRGPAIAIRSLPYKPQEDVSDG